MGRQARSFEDAWARPRVWTFAPEPLTRFGGWAGGYRRAMRVGADTGGTFTDVVVADGTVAEVPSTPDPA